MFDDDKFDEKENIFTEEESLPMDGQIGIEELYLPEPENDEEESFGGFVEPIDGQLSFGDIEKQEEIIKNTQEEIEIKQESFVEETTYPQDINEQIDLEKTDEVVVEESVDFDEIEKEPEEIDVEEEIESQQENEQTKTDNEDYGEEVEDTINIDETDDIYEDSEISIIKVSKVKNSNSLKRDKRNFVVEENKEEIKNESFEEGVDKTLNDENTEEQEIMLVSGEDEDAEQEERQEKVVSTDSGHDVVDGMLYKNIDDVLHESMIPYSEHVILDRALPRVEDGLKPVQRRILYSMYELGITPDKPYRKSARIVGDCLGKYHPHGDSSVYQAMVRMAQPFNMNELLVNGHGNFGSIDGDGAAAMRYTEARLAPLAMELLRDLEKDTVRWNLNFDDSLKEPDILPGRFPNLLVNGATGIAVGLATNIPPHNLAEVIDGVVAYIDKNNISLKEMMKIIKAPDFPTGGYILNNSDLEQAYSTGRGKIYLRAKMHIETNGVDKKNIVITEIPYQTNKVLIMQKIATLREDGKHSCLSQINDIRDESDRNGLRVVLRLKKDADIKKICEVLFKNTDLQCTFGINMVAIADGKPKQLSLMEIISYYVNYQREVVYRRTKYDLEQAKEREHILSGLIIAIKNIDAVVKIIKTSANTTEAKQRLKEKFVLSEKQAQAILDMRLARLTSLEVNKLEAEVKALRELIKKLTDILNSKKLQFDVVKTELLEIKKKYRRERLTKLLKYEENIKIPSDVDEKEQKEVYIARNALGNIKTINAKYSSIGQHEFKDGSGMAEVHSFFVKTDTKKTALFFTDKGNCYKLPVEQIPESRFKDKGVPEHSVIKAMAKDEKVVKVFAIDNTMPKGNLLFLTKYGMIKKTEFSEYGLLKTAFQAMKLKDDDVITDIIYEKEKEYSVLFVTNQGMILKAENTDIPLQGRISGGVKGVNLAAKDYCVGTMIVSEEGEVVVVTNKGFAKRMVVAGIDKMARYRKGLKAITFTADNGSSIVYADYVKTPFDIVAKDNDGEIHYRATDNIPIENRLGKGKCIDRMKKTQTITEVFKFNR